MKSSFSLLSLFLGLTLITVGCDSASTDEGVNTTVQFRVVQSLAAKKAATVVVTEAKLLVRELEFERYEDDSSKSDSTEEAEELEDFEFGPFVVDLDVANSTTTAFNGVIPAGSYDEIEFDIHKPGETEDIPDPEFREGTSGNQRYSIIVRGTSDGTPFELKITEDVEQEIEFDQPIIITDETSSVLVDIAVDVNSWFVGESAEELDPLNPLDLDAIQDAIERSFDSDEEIDD